MRKLMLNEEENNRWIGKVDVTRPYEYMLYDRALAVQGDEIKLKKIVVLYRQC